MNYQQIELVQNLYAQLTKMTPNGRDNIMLLANAINDCEVLFKLMTQEDKQEEIEPVEIIEQ